MPNRLFHIGLLSASITFANLGFAQADSVASESNAIYQEPTQVLFGDTHLHTSYSFDAFLNKNHSADPDTAYRYAKGMPVIHPYHRARVEIDTPLDFLLVSDHAELLGTMKAVNNGTAEFGEMGLWDSVVRWASLKTIEYAMDGEGGSEVFTKILPKPPANPGTDPVQDPNNSLISSLGDTSKMAKTAWHDIVETADRHNEPGKFTTLIGWEWSSIPVGSNLHRVVMSPNGGDAAKSYIPFGSDQSQYPQDLWNWLEKTGKESGSEFIAIPHNSNISNGYMFAETTLKGAPITAQYARTRMEWEPVAEITQIKGDSETNSQLSPDDEFADFENYPHYITQTPMEYNPTAADFIRPALKTGLALEQSTGVNPFKFGLIGSTDSHTGLASAEESNFWGKLAVDSTPETKIGGKIGGSKATGWSMSASGLAAVWAKENTREEIFAAFKRKEVYATSGPRIGVRMFAGWDFPEGSENSKKFADIGYESGVPMGSDLSSAEEGQAPKLLIRANKDPKGANLDRVQVVKGWVDSQGNTHEKVFDVVWSDDRVATADGKIPAITSTVDLASASYDNRFGAPELSTLWQDPQFDASRRTFYYVRVLEIPTPRHSTMDAVALQEAPRDSYPTTIQERAYTSPVWYTP